MKAQIYTHTDKDQNYTSLIVTKGQQTYYKKVLNTPEITAIQRGVSFVKNQLNVDVTEIYPHHVDKDEIINDVYINWCKINHVIGENPDPEKVEECLKEFNTECRWNINLWSLKKGIEK